MNLIKKIIYALGFRPKKTSVFYSALIEAQERWRSGKR